MLNKTFQVVYQPEPNDLNRIHWLWLEEAKALEQVGITVSTLPKVSAKKLMYRGSFDLIKKIYKKDHRYINNYNHFELYSRMSNYYPYISDLSIETFFVDALNTTTETLIRAKGWDKAFIKKDVKALEHIGEGKSIWPQTSFEEMLALYNEYPFEGKFCIRKYVDSAQLIKEEERYWVLNGNLYHRHNTIPPVVQEAAKRLNKLGSKYYTIDATPDFVVEVNPGESSDRHAVNSAALFASWIKKEFVK